MEKAPRIAVLIDTSTRTALEPGEILQNVVDLEGFFSPMAVPNVRLLELARRIEFREVGTRRLRSSSPETTDPDGASPNGYSKASPQRSAKASFSSGRREIDP